MARVGVIVDHGSFWASPGPWPAGPVGAAGTGRRWEMPGIMSIMSSTEESRSRLNWRLPLYVAAWLLVISALFLFNFVYAFSVGEARAKYADLADAFGVAMYVVGLGVPVVGAVVAVAGRKPGVAGLCAAGAVLIFLIAQWIRWFPFDYVVGY